MKKICSKCGATQPVENFFKTGKQASGKQKYRGDCKTCASHDTAEWREKNRAHYNSYMGDWRTKNPDKVRAMDIKRNYGITIDQYNQLVQDQKGLCKICESPPKGKRPLAIDHDHKTGRVRGLLCYPCNRAIVILDDSDHLKKAYEYLKNDILEI